MTTPEETAPERGSRRRSLFVGINIFICVILCHQESRETLPLQLPLYSLALSLSLYIKTHDLSPNLSSPCIYTLAVSSYTIFIVKLVGERWFFLKDQRSPIIKKNSILKILVS